MKDFTKIYRMLQKTNYCDNIRFMKGEQIMYKYAYETVSCHLSGYGLGAGTVYCIDDYRSIIEKRASQGWRYVGYIPAEKDFEVAVPCFTVRTERSKTQNEVKTARVRIGVTLYNKDTSKGHKDLSEVINKIEYYLRGKNIIGRCFTLSEDAPVDIDTSETGFYPFWIGEVFISYDLPAPVEYEFV